MARYIDPCSPSNPVGFSQILLDLLGEDLHKVREKAVSNMTKEVYAKQIGTLYGGKLKVTVEFDYSCKSTEHIHKKIEDLEKEIFKLKQQYNLY